MAKKKVGVIGVGLIWQKVHQPILQKMQDEFELVAFCDASAERRSEIAEQYPGCPVFADYNELLALDAVEVVLSLMPIPLTPVVVKAALEAGKDVVTEKPLARSVEEGRLLIETMERTGGKLFVAEQLAYREGNRVLRELLEGGEIGQVVMWQRVAHHREEPRDGNYATTPWRQRPDYPLGPLFDGGIHVIADLDRVFGPPQSVDAHGQQLRAEFGDYDHVAMLFHYESGLVGQLSFGSYLPSLKRHFTIYGTEGCIVVEHNIVAGSGQLHIEREDGAPRTVDLPEESHYAHMWRAFADAFASGETPYYTPQKALLDVALLAGVERSIKSGTRQAIDIG
jgi:scyllo-inositol 2-dehydrogenase (NADP+)